MEPDFFNDLEAALTHVGSDVFWKREVGGVVLWIAPLTMVGQGKVVETMTQADSRSNVIGETKRITLSHSIVGINEVDLREYRDGALVFPSTGRDGKPAKVSLDRYLYAKMAGWGAQFVDDAFSVYADLMESFGKQNLKNVKFENAKDPREELADLMVKVAELRDQLGLKQLVDPDQEPPAQAEGEQEEPQPEGEQEEEPQPQVSGPDFDPFRRIPPRTREIMETEGVAPQPVQQPVQAPRPPQMAAPPPMESTGPIPAPVVTRPNVPGPVHVATPSVPSEVIEEPSKRVAVAPPEIDKPHANRNPRFSPPAR